MLILLVLTWAGGPYLFPDLVEVEEAVIDLTDSSGAHPTHFPIMDTVYGSFSGLLPDTQYTIRVIRSDDQEISHSILASDSLGIIPTTALWWDVGVEYPGTRVGSLDPTMVTSYSYRCVLLRDDITVAEVPIEVLPLEESGPIVYASTIDGAPTNVFSLDGESVYVTGRNFPSNSTVRIYVFEDRHSWDTGDMLDEPVLEPQEVTVGPDQDEFTITIANPSTLTMGGYDLVVEYINPDAIIDENDLFDDIYGTGFTISELRDEPASPSDPHVEDEIACQEPPRDSSGNVIGAPNPVYKDCFCPREEVWAAVNPYAGGHDYSNQNARIYIVYDMPEASWLHGTVLNDVSGGYETITVQPGCANVNYTRIWSNPVVRDLGYDVVVDFAPFGVYDKGQDIIDSLDPRGFYVPTLWVCLESVSFNHDTTSDNADAMNIRKNSSTDVRVPEWQRTQQPEPAAYIKNKTITIKAVFSSALAVTSAKIKADKRYGCLGDMTEKTVNFSGGTSGTVSFTVSGSTPGSIRNSTQTWRWRYRDVNSTGTASAILADTRNKVFIVLARPPSPWSTAGNNEPWSEALARSCSWAYGESTDSGAAGKIAKQLFKNVGGLYDTVSGAPRYGSPGNFNMTGFLGNIPNVGVVNCYDMGKAVVAFSNVVGCNLSYRYSYPFGYLNCIYAIGRGWTNNPFYDSGYCSSSPIVPEDWNSSNGRSSFGNHAFGSISDNIFDACLTVDTDSNPDYGPPHTETWMIDEPWTGYKAKVVDDNPSTSTGYPTSSTISIY
jgi:hypothetical protein